MRAIAPVERVIVMLRSWPPPLTAMTRLPLPSGCLRAPLPRVKLKARESPAASAVPLTAMLTPAAAKPKTFYGSAEVPPATAKMRLVQIAEEIAAKRAKDEWTVPTTLERELATNPFLSAPDVETLARIRTAKDNFR